MISTPEKIPSHIHAMPGDIVSSPKRSSFLIRDILKCPIDQRKSPTNRETSNHEDEKIDETSKPANTFKRSVNSPEFGPVPSSAPPQNYRKRFSEDRDEAPPGKKSKFGCNPKLPNQAKGKANVDGESFVPDYVAGNKNFSQSHVDRRKWRIEDEYSSAFTSQMSSEYGARTKKIKRNDFEATGNFENEINNIHQGTFC